MAQLPEAANSEDNSSQGGFELLPEDDYVVAITKSEWKDTKAGTGKFIYMEMTIQEGEFAGQMLFERLNLINPNPIAVRIAKGTMNKICAACLKSEVEDTEELHGIPMEVTVRINPNDDSDFPPQNEIKNWANPDGEVFTPPWG